MREAEKYYDNTEGLEPNYVIGEFLKLGVMPGRALELGCGAGRDTVCLIKNGWYVLAIDKENVEERIRGRLEEDECKRFRFSRQRFEDVKLEECDWLWLILVCRFVIRVDLWICGERLKRVFVVGDILLETFLAIGMNGLRLKGR